jgi:NCS1 nucleoside transporter family
MDTNHSNNDLQKLQDQMAEKYKNPKNVEQFGIEPIPDELRTVKWLDLFAIFASFFITPVHMMIAGTAILVTGLSFWGAILSQVLGAAIAFTCFCLFAVAGTDYGLPGAVATRFVLGAKFSRFGPSILRWVTSMFYFAAQTLGAGLGIQALLRELTGTTYNLIVISFLFAVFQTIIAIIGFDTFKKFTRFIFPIKILGMGYIGYAFITCGLPNFEWSVVSAFPASQPGWVGFAAMTSLGAGVFMTLITDASDFCRYTRSRADMWGGVLLGATFSVAYVSFFGAYAAAAIGNWNAFDAMTYLHPSVGIIFFLLLMIVLDNWSSNILNLYTAGLCMVNVFPKIGRFWTTFISGVVATFACLFPTFIDNAGPIMDKFGLVYSPLVGVIIADFVILKRYKINVNDVFNEHGQYRYNNGINWLAVIVVVIGCFTFSLWPTAMIPSLSNAVLCLILYYVLAKVVSPYWAEIRDAIKPYEGEQNLKDVARELVKQN